MLASQIQQKRSRHWETSHGNEIEKIKHDCILGLKLQLIDSIWGQDYALLSDHPLPSAVGLGGKARSRIWYY